MWAPELLSKHAMHHSSKHNACCLSHTQETSRMYSKLSETRTTAVGCNAASNMEGAPERSAM